MTEEELKDIERRWAKATPGPWVAKEGDNEWIETTPKFNYDGTDNVFVFALEDCNDHPIADCSCNYTCRNISVQHANAIAIASAPDDISLLLAEVRRLQGPCQCAECVKTRKETLYAGHLSDCAVHNEPAYPKGECNCEKFNISSKGY